MTPVFWLLRASLAALTWTIVSAGRIAARGASHFSRRSRRRRRARILRVTDTRLLEDMGISSEMLAETLCEPRVRRAARPGLQLPPTDRPARHHF
jgi:hypothetical protein